jgi:(p)ppGpp synthase/HD superfamily hydrolase
MVGSQFVKAVERACEWHGGQVRKGGGTPYIAHLLGVASLVLEARNDEELAIAALLHDAVEDQPEQASPGRIEAEFGTRVADIVEECSDREPGEEGTAANWRPRKEAYVASLERASEDVLLVSCADKLHNARALLRDLRQKREEVWTRFHEPDPAKQLWYYGALVDVFKRRIGEPQWLPDELERAVQEIEALSRLSGHFSEPRSGT